MCTAKRGLLAALLALVFALTGCSGVLSGTVTDDLLRAPQGDAAQSAVQTALNNYLGETLQLKYPRGGSEPSPMLFADLDGDGTDEAVVLYVADSKGQNVHLAVLEALDDGTWDVTYEMEGLSTEVAAVQTVQLLQTGEQLIVGYANANLTDRYLVVYDYRSGTLTRLHEQAYTAYLAGDIAGSGREQLVTVQTGADTGVLMLQYLAGSGDALQNVQSLALDERFLSCAGLYASVSGEARGLIVDGLFAAGGRASEVLKLVDGSFVQWPQAPADGSEAADSVKATLRYQTGLAATDFDGRGTVEVPTEVLSTTTLSTARRFYYVTWEDPLADPAAEQQAASSAAQSAGTDSVPASSGARTAAAAVSSAADAAAASNADEPAASGSDAAASGTAQSGAASAAGSADSPAAPAGSADAPPVTAGDADSASLPAPSSAPAIRPMPDEPETVRFGVYDAAYGYFVRLPGVWKNHVNLQDGTLAESWQLRLREGNALALSVRVADRTRPIGVYTRTVSIGEKSVLLYFSEACSALQQKTIRTGVTVLEG